MLYIFRYPYFSDINDINFILYQERKELQSAGLKTKKEIDDILLNKGIISKSQNDFIETQKRLAKKAKFFHKLNFLKDKEEILYKYLNEIISGEFLIDIASDAEYEHTVEKSANLNQCEQVLNSREAYYKNSLEYKLESLKYILLVSRTLMFSNKKPVFKSFEEIKTSTYLTFIDNITNKVIPILNGLPQPLVRMLARDNAWGIYWSAAQKNAESLFGRKVRDLGQDQLSLVYWSNFYENIRQDPDSPEDGLLENDAFVDGWVESRYREAKGKSSPLSNVGPSDSAHKIVF